MTEMADLILGRTYRVLHSGFMLTRRDPEGKRESLSLSPGAVIKFVRRDQTTTHIKPMFTFEKFTGEFWPNKKGIIPDGLLEPVPAEHFRSKKTRT